MAAITKYMASRFCHVTGISVNFPSRFQGVTGLQFNLHSTYNTGDRMSFEFPSRFKTVAEKIYPMASSFCSSLSGPIIGIDELGQINWTITPEQPEATQD